MHFLREKIGAWVVAVAFAFYAIFGSDGADRMHACGLEADISPPRSRQTAISNLSLLYPVEPTLAERGFHCVRERVRRLRGQRLIEIGLFPCIARCRLLRAWTKSGLNFNARRQQAIASSRLS